MTTPSQPNREEIKKDIQYAIDFSHVKDESESVMKVFEKYKEQALAEQRAEIVSKIESMKKDYSDPNQVFFGDMRRTDKEGKQSTPVKDGYDQARRDIIASITEPKS